MNSILSNINYPEDLRKVSVSQLSLLASEIRHFILDTLSVKPGHLGANLGVVELSIALHYHYNTPEDIIVWDVGHQCYPHKILTGRKADFETLRQSNGISGFPDRAESIFDAFGTGHSSTSISAILGMAIANQLEHKNNKHIAVIGDASIVSGMALEGLNHLGSTDLDVLIILNDNSIGIDPSVGALKEHFNSLQNKSISSLFASFGMQYFGVIDGHNLESLLHVFEEIDKIKGPKLLHVKTIKGKGYAQAEKDQVTWHAPGRFDKLTGNISKSTQNQLSYQAVFGQTMSQLMQSNSRIVAITPAMISGSNLTEVKKQFPQQTFDVGIAEQHAVTFAAGLASQGIKPYLAIYSTFLQRAYDQVIHDVAIQNLPVVFCVDRAGVVGTDGATHHGYFDIAYLRQIPNMIVSAPSNAVDFANLLYTAQFINQPMSIRFPRGNSTAESLVDKFEKIEIGKVLELHKGNRCAILTFGTIGERVHSIIQDMDTRSEFSVYSFLFCKPVNYEALELISKQYETIVTFEDGIVDGGFGSTILETLSELNFKGKIFRKGYPDRFLSHAEIKEIEEIIGLDDKSIKEFLQSL